MKRLAAVVSSVFLAFVILAYALSPILVERGKPGPADVIVVIGGDHKPERMREAAQLFNQGVAPKVVVSSGTIVIEGGHPVVESELMLRQGEEYGIPRTAMFPEQESLTTHQNAEQTAELCRTLQCRSVVLVTSAYHSRRAAVIFRQVYGPDVSVVVVGASQSGCPPCFPVDFGQYYVALYEYQNWLRLWFGWLA